MSAPARARWRLRRFQLAHALGLGRRGWFIPYRYVDQSPPPTAAYPADIFEAARADISHTLELAARFAPDWPAFAGRPTPPTPRFDQDWFPGLDAAVLYGLVRERQPALIVEVGSGHSTRFAARAMADAGSDGRIIAIDPAPRADIASLAPRVEIRREAVQAADPVVFSMLGPGDVLFIDSSHILMPGSDVDILLNRILPMLPAGVLVHIHDILLPDTYPEAWTWRGHNEQNAVATLLQGGGFRILAANAFARQRMRAEVERLFEALPPSPKGAVETSLWLEKTAPLPPASNARDDE